ncbi:MAG: hypothetical protein LBR21_08290 [Propionibacteriaceae bacterium]|jgi:hypothetical protein|nr:hypothetical protein [Propionibacteriaceae bacterium]
MRTRWADVGPLPLNEHPRPQFSREEWLNLNGEWDYAILPTGSPLSGYQGKILVPFAPETLLSGVGRVLQPDETLYYRRFFDLSGISGKTVLLHFDAVDWECRVRLNSVELQNRDCPEPGVHRGGYLPFTFDITDIVRAGTNELEVEVSDPSDTHWNLRGKQALHPATIWYTPTSGIWQTVWIEVVPNDYLESVRITPDIDRASVRIEPKCRVSALPNRGAGDPATVKARILDGGALAVEAEIAPGKAADIKLPNPHLWSPDDPHLYTLELEFGEDRVRSYFGMRKFSVGVAGGVPRLMLNNEPLFHNGVLDQGYWPDGGLTAPSDEALAFDVQAMKNLGFNMLRKHVKVESARWYYHCDRLGMLVWQDLPSGGAKPGDLVTMILPFIGIKLDDGPGHYRRFGREDADGRQNALAELEEMVEYLYNCVSLAMWVPFNEGWGQFDAALVAGRVAELDPTRTVDHASGWHDQGGGDCDSRHIYFRRLRLPKPKQRALVLSEFGGYSLPIPGHIWEAKEFGYKGFHDTESLSAAIAALYREQLAPAIRKGLSAAVYTQLSDVEGEVNGLLSYDREVSKLGEDAVAAIKEAGNER